MSTNRTIQQITYAQQFDMGGFPVRQSLPAQGLENLDPFLLLHHANIKITEHTDLSRAGVGAHPHRGFSPVTFIFEGGVHHRDSRGNDNIVYAGGTQWMNAGMGIIHSERPPHDIHAHGSKQEIIQLWVNTPAAFKMKQPEYFPLNRENTPQISSEDGLTGIAVITGELHGTKGPIPTFSQVNSFSINTRKSAHYFLPIPVTHNAFVYVLKGKINLNQTTPVEAYHMAVFNNDGQGFSFTTEEDAVLLVGSGEPLNEPIASHGPFVMNTQTEIMEAFRDYQMGKMGVLIEE
ncbi:MAG: pirin family protein [Chitinophagaceae bacterium]|nr:pirin family protein [Chitinophagaceae bacterium]